MPSMVCLQVLGREAVGGVVVIDISDAVEEPDLEHTKVSGVSVSFYTEGDGFSLVDGKNEMLKHV